MLVIADSGGTVLDIFEPPHGMEWWPADGTDGYRRVVTANLPPGVGFNDVQVVRTDDRSLAKFHLTVVDGEIIVGDERTSPEPEPEPDVDGLLVAARDLLGKAKAREVARAYPDLTQALDRGNWPMVREAVDDAQVDGVVTEAQHADLVALLDTYHIPGGSA